MSKGVTANCKQTYGKLHPGLAGRITYSRQVCLEHRILQANQDPDVLLVCPASHRPAISHYVHSNTSFPSLSIDIQSYDESENLNIGTCTLLRQFSSRIPNDFVLLPCDFIPPPSLPLSSLLDKFRTDSIADGSIATACWFEGQRPGKGMQVDEWSHVASPTSLIWDESSGTLVYIDTPEAIDDNTEDIELRMAMVSQCVHSLFYLANTLISSGIHGRDCLQPSKIPISTSADMLSWMFST